MSLVSSVSVSSPKIEETALYISALSYINPVLLQCFVYSLSPYLKSLLNLPSCNSQSKMKGLISTPVLHCLIYFLTTSHGCGTYDVSNHEVIYERLAKRTVQEPKKTIINNVQLFDGIGMTTPKTIILNNGIITYVGPDNGATAEVQVNGKGKFLVPGLIDSHCHVSTPENLDTMASYGVTTAINMACYNYDMCTALMEMNGTTSMITASRPAVGTGSPHSKLGNASITGVDTLDNDTNTAQWVQQYAFPPGAPSAFLKATAEPGGPDQEILTGVVSAARQLGKFAVMHASYFSAYVQAVTARPAGIQHVPTDKIIPASMAQTIKTQQQFVTPTMAIFRIGANSAELSQLFHQKFNWTITNDNVKAIHKAGVPLLAGTDSAVLGNFTMPFGFGMHCELELLVEAGLTTLDALQAATTRAARIMGLQDRGVMLPGKRADLLLLNSHPLLNISNTRDIARVWTGGIEYTNVTRNLHQQCAKLNLTQV